ncbi:hypothetical protein N9J88_03395 [Porticoccaceae bacterium]|nr:hypothetical protein [Porticoccaceae bacterium]
MATIQGVTKYQASVDPSPSNVGNREVFVIERKDGVDRLVSSVVSDGSGNYTITNLSAKDRDIYTVTVDDFGIPWEANLALIPGDRVRPSGVFAGYVYEVTTAGNTGTTEPTWWLTHGQSGTIGAAVADAFEFAQPEAHGPFFLPAEVNMDNAMQDNNPVAYYDFTEVTGSFLNQGSDSNFRTLNGTQADKNGILMLSQNIPTLVTTNYHSTALWGATDDFAVVIFFNVGASGFLGEFFAHGTVVRMQMTPAGALFCESTFDVGGLVSLSPAAAVDDSSPHTAIFKREGTSLKLFVDGIEADSAIVASNDPLIADLAGLVANSNISQSGLGVLALYPKTTISDAGCASIHEAIFGEFDLLNT